MTQPPKSDKAKRGQPDSPDEVTGNVSGQAAGGPNWANRTLFHGDNLTCLRAMNSESVDLIATDPPFNKGRDFHATPDSLAAGAKFQDRWSWEQDVHQDWVDQITDDYPKLMEAIQSARAAHSDGMGAFMCFMAVRLLEMRRVLKDTGSIYLHCDQTASHYIKAVMDAIFGYKNFRNEIVWGYAKWSNVSNQFQLNHDNILFYSVSKNNVFNQQYLLSKDKILKLEKGYQINRANNVRQLIVYDWQKAKTVSADRYDKIVDRTEANPGSPMADFWHDINILNSQAKERTGYPTQKPLPLYERIIKASSNEGDMVLDPFCGCATTLVAAEATGRQWVGMDIWDNAGDVVLKRLSLHQLVHKGKTRKDLFDKEVYFTADPPVRNDGGEEAAPFLRVKERVKEPEGGKMSRAEMYDFLLAQHGPVCQGCDRRFDDPRYLELDHNTPRADGGINHISNRILLCGPCNNLKSNTFTLSGLRRENKKKGYMAKDAP